jgi:hypothetical protein
MAARLSSEGSEAMSRSDRSGPQPLADILGALFTARGFGRIRALTELEAAWNAAVGEPTCYQTQVGSVRRGVLNVTVAHPALLEELAAFRKSNLLASLGRDLPAAGIQDIRFRVGPIETSTGTTREQEGVASPSNRRRSQGGT